MPDQILLVGIIALILQLIFGFETGVFFDEVPEAAEWSLNRDDDKGHPCGRKRHITEKLMGLH